MKRVAAGVAVGLVLTGLLAVGSVAGADDSDTLTTAIETAESVETGLAVASDTTTQLVSGVAVGAGVGLVLGSGVTFLYWRRQIG